MSFITTHSILNPLFFSGKNNSKHRQLIVSKSMSVNYFVCILFIVTGIHCSSESSSSEEEGNDQDNNILNDKREIEQIITGFSYGSSSVKNYILSQI